MALTRTLRASGTTSGMGTNSWASASFTPSNNSLLVVAVGIVDNGAGSIASALTAAGGGWTYTDRVTGGQAGGTLAQIRIFTAPVTTGASMTVTFDCGANNVLAAAWYIWDFTGYDTGTPTGGKSTAVADTDGPYGAQSSTLDAAPSTDDFTVAMFMVDGNTSGTYSSTKGATFTAETTLTSTTDAVGASGEYRTGSTSTTADWADADTGSMSLFSYALGGLVIKASTGTNVDAGHASGTGTAYDAVTSVDRAQAGHASGTGTAYGVSVPGAGTSVDAGHASGSGYAIGPNKFAYVVQVTGAAITTSRSPSLTFTGYTAKANDLVIMWASSTTTSHTMTEPSGWVNPLGAGVDVESDSHQIACAYHLVTSAEESGGTTTYTATNWYGATHTGYTQGVVVRNAETTDPIDGSGSTFSSTNTVTPHVLAGITGTGGVLLDHSLVLSSVAKDATGDYGTTNPTGYTWLRNDNTNNGRWIGVGTSRTTASSNVSAQNITPSAGDEYASITVAVRQVIISMAAEAIAATGTSNAATNNVAPNVASIAATGTAYDVTVGGSSTNALAGHASGAATVDASSVKVSPNAGTSSGTATVDNPAGSVKPNVSAVAATGTADTASTKVSPNAGTASGTGTAYSVSFYPFVATASGNGRYLLDQQGQPILCNGISPQMFQKITTSAMDDLIADAVALGINAFLSVGSSAGNFGINSDGDNVNGDPPWPNSGIGAANDIASTINDNFWDHQEAFIDKCAAAGITVFYNVLDNIGWGPEFDEESDADCFTLGQSIGARFAAKANIVWSFGVDYYTSQWSTLNSKYGAVAAGIRDAGDTHLMTLWHESGVNSTDNTDWDGTTSHSGIIWPAPDVNFVYTYYSSEMEVKRSWNDAAIPVGMFESHYLNERNATIDGISTTTRKSMRKQQFRAFTYGALVGGFPSSDLLWEFNGSYLTELADVVFTHIADTYAHIASLDGWWLLEPDYDQSFITSGNDAEPTINTNDADTHDYITASVASDGSLALLYVTEGTFTVDLTELVGSTKTHYWYDPTSGDTTAPTTGQPTYPGNNDAGDPDWLLVFQATSDASVDAGHASGTGTSNGASENVAPNAGTATATGTADTTSTKVSPNVTAIAATGTGYDATVSTQSNTQAPAGHASGTGTADTDSTKVSPNATAIAATGTGYDATVDSQSQGQTNAGHASATATVDNPSTKVTFNAGTGTAAGTAEAGLPAIGAAPGAITASATLGAAAVSIFVLAGLATATGTANNAEADNGQTTDDVFTLKARSGSGDTVLRGRGSNSDTYLRQRGGG